MDIIIAGAGGYGIEAYDLIYHINRKYKSVYGKDKYVVIGFIDDFKDSVESTGIDVPILGKIDEWQPVGKERYILGIAIPKAKEKVAMLLRTRGATFESLIAPTAVIDEGVTFGEGCTFKDFSIVSRGALIGEFVNVCGAVGEAKIGDYCTLGAYCNVTNSEIGKRVFIGSQSFILNGKKIGDDVMIGAGSIVVNNVESGVTVFGNPAKRL